MPRATVFQATQLGVETTSGTTVAANKRLLCTYVSPTPNVPRPPYRPMGFKAPTTSTKQKEWTEAGVEGVICYTDLSYLLAGILTTPAITTPTGATNARRHTFTPSATAADTPKTFTVESGSSSGAERFSYGFMDSLTLRWTREEASVTGTMMGRALTDGISMTGSPTALSERPVDPNSVSIFVGNATTNEVQTVTKGTHTAGQFKLVFTGVDGSSATTADIAFNAAASAVQSALEALSNIGAGNVAVTGAVGGPWTVTFQGFLAGLNVDALTIAAGSTPLSGGSGEAVTQTTAGGLTRLTAVDEFQMTIGDRFAEQFTLDASQSSFSYIVERAPEATAQLVMAHDSASVALMDDLRNTQTKILKLVSTGSLIEAGFPFKMQLQFPFRFTETDRADADDEWTATYDMVIMHDTTYGWISAVVDNNISSL